MAVNSSISGLSTVLGALAREMKKVEVKNKRGLTMATLLIKRESMVMCPRATGNLEGSHETEVIDTGRGFRGEVRVGAEYALSVHECTHCKFRKPGAQAKFLEKALFNNQKAVFDILGTSGRIV